jgi:N4-gp56 family major capsid protein
MPARQYNNPPTTPSSIGKQLQTQFYQKQALIEARKEQYFSQLADVTAMPKHMGKKIVRYHYIPLLDDANVNDQGINAAGTTTANGNLYGSSKDVGTIPNKMPLLSETGGRVNRVGFKRQDIEGTFQKFGFFHEWTQESMDFDTDEELEMHIQRELVNGASELTEDALQIDLLNSAGTLRYAGNATSMVTLDAGDIVSYSDLMHLSIDLDNNRTPKKTTVVTGSRMVDTKTIDAGRVMFIGSELLPTIRAMKDLHNQPAFVPVRQYGDATTILTGEVGSIDQFRLIVVPEMMKWSGGGATSVDATYYTTSGKYDVFPMLVVGDESFTTIGFQTDGKSVKFTTITKKPGDDTADRTDPYGETGFSSIKWYYGFMALRPERIALIKTLAKM